MSGPLPAFNEVEPPVQFVHIELKAQRTVLAVILAADQFASPQIQADLPAIFGESAVEPNASHAAKRFKKLRHLLDNGGNPLRAIIATRSTSLLLKLRKQMLYWQVCIAQESSLSESSCCSIKSRCGICITQFTIPRKGRVQWRFDAGVGFWIVLLGEVPFVVRFELVSLKPYRGEFPSGFTSNHLQLRLRGKPGVGQRESAEATAIVI